LRIAYVTATEILGPQNTGGIQCCNRNLNLLKQAFGEENVFICAITKHKKYLSKSCGNTTVFFSDRRKLSILKNTLQGRLQFGKDVEDSVLQHIKTLGCNVAVLEFSRMGLLQERLPADIKQVLFMHNIEREYIVNLTKKHPSYFILKRAFERNEALAVTKADIVITLNYRDAERLNEYYNRKSELILPITMDDNFVQIEAYKQKTSTSKLQILFVGSLFAPNEHGVTWFINEVMPHADAEFTVVGRDFEQLADKLNRSNVKIVGTVDDLSEYYLNADAVVSPILFGAGMKVKTAEALMYGKPMFATDEALEGYDVDSQENIFRCNSAKEFITSINAYAAREQYISIDDDIRALFLDKHYTPKYISVIHDLITERKRV